MEPDDLTRLAVLGLLAEHLADMHAVSPRELVHAFPTDQLRAADVTAWSVRDGGELAGVWGAQGAGPAPRGGEVDADLGCRPPAEAGRAVLWHILAVARSRGYRRLSLETGAGEAFAPAHALYRSEGFVPCGPFGDYPDDPRSVFLTRELEPTCRT